VQIAPDFNDKEAMSSETLSKRYKNERKKKRVFEKQIDQDKLAFTIRLLATKSGVVLQ